MPVANSHPQRRWANGRDAGLWHFCITPTPDFLPHYSARTRHRFKWKFSRACRIMLAKVLVTCLERDTFFKRPFPVTTYSASFCPPSPITLSFPVEVCLSPHPPLIALSWPSPYSCTLIPLDSPCHTLIHSCFRILKHTHYCSIPAKGFFF